MIRFILLIIIAICSGHLSAQSPGNQQTIESAAKDYLQQAGSYSAIYYGKAHEAHPPALNNPYLKSEEFSKGRLSYNGIIYPEVLLRLDLNRNELVVQSPDFRNIVLTPDNVDFAEFYDLTIIYFRSDSFPNTPSTGYYALLYSDKCRVLKKQTAFSMDKIDDGKLRLYYYTKTNFFLFKDDVYYNIKNKRGLLKVLQPRKKELKHFISSNKLSFRRNPDEFITKTVSKYEKLSESK